MSEFVNVDNFARAETARMFDGILAQAGGINRWVHLRGPVPLDQQTVIRTAWSSRRPPPSGRYSFNGVTAVADPDGAFTIDLDAADQGYTNHLPVMDGWNYAIRLYRPRPEILDGSWVPPVPRPVG